VLLRLLVRRPDRRRVFGLGPGRKKRSKTLLLLLLLFLLLLACRRCGCCGGNPPQYAKSEEGNSKEPENPLRVGAFSRYYYYYVLLLLLLSGKNPRYYYGLSFVFTTTKYHRYGSTTYGTMVGMHAKSVGQLW